MSGWFNTPWLVLLTCPLGLVLLILLARALLFIVNVEGESMYPALGHGDRVLALRYWPSRRLRRGQIIVTRYEATQWYPDPYPTAARNERYIKRIVGLPGDRVNAPNYELPDSLHAKRELMNQGQGRPIWFVPHGHYFVMGDSRGFDSATIGPVPFRAFCGIVLMKLKRRDYGYLHTASANSHKASEVSEGLGSRRPSEEP
jgi:signal peptidase I